MSRIIRNSAKCLICGDEVESKHRHDFVRCKCKALAVDGGTDYLKRVGEPDDYEDTSIHTTPGPDFIREMIRDHKAGKR